LAPKRQSTEPADWQFAGVKLTLSRKCRTAAVDPSRESRPAGDVCTALHV
jgi:hypothetical protein